MERKFFYFRYFVVAVLLLSLPGCGSDSELPADDGVPPQTTESESVSIGISLNALAGNGGAVTRAAGMDTGSGGVKTRWEPGDKVYFNYTKTFSSDAEILNVFTVNHIDEDDPTNAVFTCSNFIMPRGIEEGQLVYVGQKTVDSMADLQSSTIALGEQTQHGSNDLSGIGNYLHMKTSYFQMNRPQDIAQVSPVLKHTCSLVTLQLKRPEGWNGNGLSTVTLSLNSENVTLLGTTDNHIVMNLEDAVWDNDYIIVHFIVNPSGIINDGNSWTVNFTETGTQQQANLVYTAKPLEEGKHYTSVVSDDPSDYETPAHIDVPGFDDGGEAF